MSYDPYTSYHRTVDDIASERPKRPEVFFPVAARANEKHLAVPVRMMHRMPPQSCLRNREQLGLCCLLPKPDYIK